MDSAKILERLSPGGMALLVIGALLGYFGGRIAKKVFPMSEARMTLIIKGAGLALVLVAALILLDFI